MKFFITFGSGMYGGLYTNKYAIIERENERAARYALGKQIDMYFSFIYPIEGLEEQVERFGLTEVPLRQIIDLYAWARFMHIRFRREEAE